MAIAAAPRVWGRDLGSRPGLAQNPRKAGRDASKKQRSRPRPGMPAGIDSTATSRDPPLAVGDRVPAARANRRAGQKRGGVRPMEVRPWAQGQREDERDWGRGLWGEANGRESGLGTRGQWQGELGGGVASGVKPMAGSAAWARPMAGRAPERGGGGRSQTRKAVGAGSRADNLSSPLQDELGHAPLVAPAPPPREALRVALGPSRSASSSCPRRWGRGGHLPPAGRLQPPGLPKAAALAGPRAPRSAGSRLRGLRRWPWARGSAQRTT